MNNIAHRDSASTDFDYGNPGDVALSGDWNCNGEETPGAYRQSDGFVYLRMTNTQGIADRQFYFGNPGDFPVVGDFNGDGCDTVSIYRPATTEFHIINSLANNNEGLGAATAVYIFGNYGDTPFAGDFDGDGVDTVGLHRQTTGLVYYRNSHTQGVADNSFVFGDGGDRFVAGDWDGDGDDTAAVYRPSNGTFYIKLANATGVADVSFHVGSFDTVVIAPRKP